MAAFFRTARLDPTQVPTCPVELDTDHPLAQRIQHCVVFWNGRDYGAAGAQVTSANSSIAGSSIGTGLATAGVAGSHIILEPAGPGLVGAPGTAAVLFSARANGTGSYQALASRTQDSNNREIGFFYAQNWSAGSDYVVWGSSGFSDAAGGSVILNQPTLVTVTSESKYYQGASLELSFTPGTSAFAQPWMFGEDPAPSGGGVPANAVYLLFATWTRVLGADSIAWLNVEPFGMLRPLQRRTWFVPASGASTLLAGRGSSSTFGRGFPALPLGLRGAGEAHGRGMAGLAGITALVGRGAAEAAGRGRLFVGYLLWGVGRAASRGAGHASGAAAMSARGASLSWGVAAPTGKVLLAAFGAGCAFGAGVAGGAFFLLFGRGGSASRGAAAAPRGTLTLTAMGGTKTTARGPMIVGTQLSAIGRGVAGLFARACCMFLRSSSSIPSAEGNSAAPDARQPLVIPGARSDEDPGCN